MRWTDVLREVGLASIGITTNEIKSLFTKEDIESILLQTQIVMKTLKVFQA
jgi:hypothetical protein